MTEEFKKDTIINIAYIESKASDIIQMGKERVLHSHDSHMFVRIIAFAVIIVAITLLLIILYYQFTTARIIFQIIFRAIVGLISHLVSFSKNDNFRFSPPSSPSCPVVQEANCTSSVKYLPQNGKAKLVVHIPFSGKMPLEKPPLMPTRNKRPFPEPLPSVCLVQRFNSLSTIFIPTKLDSVAVVALFDTGSAITIVSKRIANLLKSHIGESTLSEGISSSGTPIKILRKDNTCA